MAPGAYPHAHIAVGADFTPIAETRLCIQFPFLNALELLLIAAGDGIGGTATGAFFTKGAKVFDADIHRCVRHQGQIGGYGKKPDPRAEFFGDQISKAARFPQTGVYGGRHQ